jgi:hypothetical protein
MALLTDQGPIWVEPADRRARSTLARHLNAVRRYLEYGDDRRLREFEGQTVETRDGQRLPLLTDLDTIDRLAEGGEIHFEVYRR